MSTPALCLLALLATSASTALAGCASHASPPPQRAVVRAAMPAPERAVPRVTLFVANDVCRSLRPVDVKLAEPSPAGAVRAIVRSRALAGLSLSDPEVRVERNTARVDLRTRPTPRGGQRSLHELSACEQLALLSAIRYTLKANTQWGIRQVVFTDRGSLLAI